MKEAKQITFEENARMIEKGNNLEATCHFRIFWKCKALTLTIIGGAHQDGFVILGRYCGVHEYHRGEGGEVKQLKHPHLNLTLNLTPTLTSDYFN